MKVSKKLENYIHFNFDFVLKSSSTRIVEKTKKIYFGKCKLLCRPKRIASFNFENFLGLIQSPITSNTTKNIARSLSPIGHLL